MRVDSKDRKHEQDTINEKVHQWSNTQLSIADLGFLTYTLACSRAWCYLLPQMIVLARTCSPSVTVLLHDVRVGLSAFPDPRVCVGIRVGVGGQLSGVPATLSAILGRWRRATTTAT